MKPFKYLLALPFALTSLVACGNSYSKISYDSAVKVANSYLPSIKNHKASAISISGHVNSIKIKGDCTFWSYSKPLEDIEGGEDLLTLIPNFDIKNGEIVVDQQEIATTSIPASILSMADTATTKLYAGGEKKPVVVKKSVYSFLVNLPKFPMNRNIIKALYGFEELKRTTDGEIDWDKTVAKSWDEAEVTFAKNGNGGLKITIDTDDIMTFFTEVMTATSGGKVNADPEPAEKKYPLTATITTNSIGYVDSLSVKTKIEKAEYKYDEKPDIYYFALNGDLKADFSLRFKQSFSKPMSIKYQLSYYEDVDEEKSEIPEIVWGPRKLKLNKTKSIGLTTNLDDFKNYLTFDWYKNLAGEMLGESYDDPYFYFNYWDTGYNIAFTNMNYDVLAIPTYNKTTMLPNCEILGAAGRKRSNAYEVIGKSYVTTSIDGRIISTDEGLPSGSQKLLEAAGDRFCRITNEDGVSLSADEIFVNSNMLNSSSAECIINIAVASPKAEK